MHLRNSTKRTALERKLSHESLPRCAWFKVFCCCLLAVQSIWAAEKQYTTGKLVNVQHKTRDRVDLYLVNTPVTTAVPYLEITLRLRDTEYVAEFTPRHEEDQMPSDWIPGAPVKVRKERHYLFLKRSDGTEMRWTITKHSRLKDQQQ